MKSSGVGNEGQSSQLFSKGLIVSALSGLSRLLGLLRDLLVATLFGVSAATDVFFVALSLSQFIRNIALEGAFSQMMVTVFANIRQRLGMPGIRWLGARISSIFWLVSLLIVMLALLRPAVPVAVFGGGFLIDDERRELALAWLPLVMLYLPPILLAGLAVAMQNAAGRFSAAALTPALFNLLIIAMLLITARLEAGMILLVIAIPLAGLFQWLFHQWRLGHLGLLALPRMEGLRSAEVQTFSRLSATALITVLTLQLTVPINNLIASFLPTGSLSLINYANRLAILPVGLIGVAAATVLLPTLAKAYERGDLQYFGENLRGGLRLIWLLGLPATVGLLLLAKPIVLTLFGYGALQSEQALNIALALQALAPGVVPSMLVSLLGGALLACKAPGQALRVALLLLPFSIAVKVMLAFGLQYYWGMGFLGIALGVSLLSWINAWLLWRALRHCVAIPLGIRPAVVLRLTLALGAMSALLILAPAVTLDWNVWQPGERLLKLAALCFGGALIYLSLVWLLGERPQAYLRKVE